MAPKPATRESPKEPKRSNSAPPPRAKKATSKTTDATPHVPSYAQSQIAKKRPHTPALFDDVEDLDTPGSTAAAMGFDPVPPAGAARRTKTKKDQKNPNSEAQAALPPLPLPQNDSNSTQNNNQDYEEFEDVNLFDIHAGNLVAHLNPEDDKVNMFRLREKVEARLDHKEIPRPKWTPIRIDVSQPWSPVNNLGVIGLGFPSIEDKAAAKEVVVKYEDKWKAKWVDDMDINTPNLYVIDLPDNQGEPEFTSALIKAGGTADMVKKMKFVKENKQQNSRDWALWTDGADSKEKEGNACDILDCEVTFGDGKGPLLIKRWAERPQEYDRFKFYVTGTPDLLESCHFETTLKKYIHDHMEYKLHISYTPAQKLAMGLRCTQLKHMGKHVGIQVATNSAKMSLCAREYMLANEVWIESTAIRYYASVPDFLRWEIT